MLAELKRCNSIGDIGGLIFLVSMLSDKPSVTKSEIANRCALENGVTVNCTGAIAFLQYLDYVESDGDSVIPNDELSALGKCDRDILVKAVAERCITKMTEDGIFDSDSTCFDADRGHLGIKRSAFPLAYAAIRNFLTAAGVLDKEEAGEICIQESYEAEFSSILRSRKEKFTLEQLLHRQEEQSKRGLEAEEFVLKLERERLPSKRNKIKRISDFDVSAGYDLVSFISEDSTVYDRFIEVKCHLGSPHFYWSENEADVAKIKGDKYILCLVDYDKMSVPGYSPEYITNPYEKIFSDDTWLVNTASYKVQKL